MCPRSVLQRTYKYSKRFIRNFRNEIYKFFLLRILKTLVDVFVQYLKFFVGCQEFNCFTGSTVEFGYSFKNNILQ